MSESLFDTRKSAWSELATELEPESLADWLYRDLNHRWHHHHDIIKRLRLYWAAGQQLDQDLFESCQAQDDLDQELVYQRHLQACRSLYHGLEASWGTRLQALWVCNPYSDERYSAAEQFPFEDDLLAKLPQPIDRQALIELTSDQAAIDDQVDQGPDGLVWVDQPA